MIQKKCTHIFEKFYEYHLFLNNSGSLKYTIINYNQNNKAKINTIHLLKKFSTYFGQLDLNSNLNNKINNLENIENHEPNTIIINNEFNINNSNEINTNRTSEFFIIFKQILIRNNLDFETIGNEPLTIKTSLMREAMLNCSQDMYISPYERNILRNALKITDTQLQSYLKTARVDKRKGSSIKIIPEEAKEKIRNWLEEHEYKMPTSSERKELREQTGLGHKQLLDQIYYLSLKPGIITDEVKEMIKEWLINNDNRLPTKKEREKLSESTKLTIPQLNNQIHYLREENETLSKFAKQYIEEWLENNNYRIPTFEEKIEIKNSIKISKKQLDTQINKLIEKTNDENKDFKEIINTWLEKNNFRSPTSEERLELQNLTRMGRHRLNCALQRLREIRGEVTEDIKIIISNWMKENNFRNPNKLEKEYLLQRTGISRTQLYYLIRKNMEHIPSDKIEQARIFVSNWADKNTTRPNKDEIAYLLQETQLALRQLNTMLQSLREKNGIISQESKNILKQWLHENDFRTKLTSKEKFLLLKQTGWNKNQLKAQLRIMTEFQGEISAETQAILKNWINSNQGRSPNQEERKILIEQTGWSPSQLRHQIRMVLNPKGEITENSKSILRQWLVENKFNLPNREQRSHLLEITGWNTKQLLDQIKRMS